MNLIITDTRHPLKFFCSQVFPNGLFSDHFFKTDEALETVVKINYYLDMTSVPPLVHQVADSEAKGQAKALFEQMKEAAGKVPKWMRVMANCEDVLLGFFTMFKAIMDDAPVDKLLKWRIALKISDLNKCEFCVSVAKQQLRAFGLTDQEIERAEFQGFSEKEKVALEYAIACAEHAYNIDPKVMKKMKKYWRDEQIVEISSVVGLFSFINRFNDSLGVLPDVE